MSSKARIAVIGAGWWAAQNHIPVLKAHPDVTLTGICSIDRDSLRKVQTAYDIPFATEDFHELLEREPLDGVIVSSPHVLHYEHARAAILRGYHVLVEKPFTTAANQARELVELERRAAVTIVIPFGYNFSDMARAAADWVGSGALGELRHAVLHMATATRDLLLGHALGATRTHLLQPDPRTWADAARAGGFGWGQLCHALGLLFMLVDDDPAVVFAVTERADSGSPRCGDRRPEIRRRLRRFRLERPCSRHGESARSALVRQRRNLDARLRARAAGAARAGRDGSCGTNVAWIGPL